jgi:hypothetical protein
VKVIAWQADSPGFAVGATGHEAEGLNDPASVLPQTMFPVGDEIVPAASSVTVAEHVTGCPTVTWAGVQPPVCRAVGLLATLRNRFVALSRCVASPRYWAKS